LRIDAPALLAAPDARACCRASAIEAWHSLSQGPAGLLGSLAALPPGQQQQQLDLSQPFRPGALLSALSQQAARQAGVALGQLQLVACWRGARLADGSGLAVPVTGLLLQGALFDGTGLQPVQQDSPLLAPAPALTLAWLHPAAPRPHPDTLSLPLYSSPERSKVVAELQLPTGGVGGTSDRLQQRQWLLAGVALVLPA
jgi:hypothetical protein